ncbi:uncharacterized protein SPSK_01326 [Sporothrix schenckii 1099-18]|uniref:Uncharacterized protein n=1 Tax=Sporothrix schenckii 1099-18 TaxID=1397361 RepID=A0A0F2LX44_SPOSC|nr:uncharacterized protein SPSK_01326 [Sporothrix schenckii 1099-18]KJR81429.1 hypothetical protein SPSK_01326 [Sporothrix schenckii 1099-18]
MVRGATTCNELLCETGQLTKGGQCTLWDSLVPLESKRAREQESKKRDRVPFSNSNRVSGRTDTIEADTELKVRDKVVPDKSVQALVSP